MFSLKEKLVEILLLLPGMICPSSSGFLVAGSSSANLELYYYEVLEQADSGNIARKGMLSVVQMPAGGKYENCKAIKLTNIKVICPKLKTVCSLLGKLFSDQWNYQIISMRKKTFFPK